MNVSRTGIRRWACVVALVSLVSGTAAQAVPIDWVTVGDPGNKADNTTGYGAVADSFLIMKYEWTNSQYATFLNAVAAADPYSLYNVSMGLGGNNRGGILRSGSSGSYTYTTIADMGDKPVNWVNWFDAARVANWMHNGQGSGGTETGAYTLNGAVSGTAPARNPGAKFFIPTGDQWYKAAFYKGSGTNAGYWTYATQSDTAPTTVTAGTTGIGSAGSSGNFANYLNAADWNGQDGNVTTVGTNGGSGAYGTFDMNGNVAEWNDLTGAAGSTRGLWGGSYGTFANALASTNDSVNGPVATNNSIGFRLAALTTAVPEIDPAGFGSVAALLTGALGLIERRRLKAKAG